MAFRTTDLQPGDYHIFYEPYIAALGDVELNEFLKMQLKNFPHFLKSIPKAKLGHRYEEGKWSVAEVLIHMIDAERVFQYRALRISRGDITPLPGFDQDSYVPRSYANKRSLESIVKEYKIVRRSTIALFENFSNETLGLKGIASQADVTVGALGFMICGHQKHHKRILDTRYL